MAEIVQKSYTILFSRLIRSSKSSDTTVLSDEQIQTIQGIEALFSDTDPALMVEIVDHSADVLADKSETESRRKRSSTANEPTA